MVIEVPEKVDDNRDYQITPEDLTNWEAEYGEIPDNAMILFYTGLSAYLPNNTLAPPRADRKVWPHSASPEFTPMLRSGL